MKNIGMIFAIGLALSASLIGFAQSPPPNDNFANATVLTGADLTFSGTLAGATLENSGEAEAYNYYINGPGASQSVWWKWTAPVSTVLNLMVVSKSPDNPLLQGIAGFGVYTATNGSTSPGGLILPALSFKPFSYAPLPISISVPVTGGTDYYIQLIGNNSANCTFALVATNTPVILQQPKSQILYSNASALFYVIYAGLNQTNFTFQWQFNGTNLPDETAPMLALNNIDSTMAGNYTVVVSNDVGFAISQPATLSVRQFSPPTLSATDFHSNSLAFTLNGESGRSYRLESSTNLVDWIPEEAFQSPRFAYYYMTSVTPLTNSSLSITISNNSPRKFFRVRPYVPVDADAEICINNLREIIIAKRLFEQDRLFESGNDVGPTYTPYDAQVLPYFPHQVLPVCPDDPYQWFDTSYYIATLQQGTTCKIHVVDHLLEQNP